MLGLAASAAAQDVSPPRPDALWRGSSRPEGSPVVHPGTGNVMLEVPVLRSMAADSVELDIALVYNSIRADRATAIGDGWTHSLLLYYYEEPDPDGGVDDDVVVVDGSGREFRFENEGAGSFLSPTLVEASLLDSGGHLELRFFEGSSWVFAGTPDTAGRFRIERIEHRDGRIARFQNGGPGGAPSRVTSPWGRTVDFLYDGASGALATIVHPDGNRTELAHAGTRLASVTDPLGHTRSFQYGASAALLTRDGHANGVWYDITYSDWEREVHDRDGLRVARYETTFGYFPTSLDEAIDPDTVYFTDGQAVLWPLCRDDHGRITHRWTPDYSATPAQLVFGSSGDPGEGRVVQRVDHLGRTDSYEYDAFGNLTRHVDREGNATTYEFGDATWPSALTRLVEPDGDAWTYTYDPATGEPTSIADPLVESGQDAVIQISYAYHAAIAGVGGGPPLPGRLQTIERTDRNGVVHRVEVGLDGTPSREVLDPDGAALTVEYPLYDGMGRPLRVVEHLGGGATLVRARTYDALGRVLTWSVDPDGLDLRTTSTYGPSGLLVSETDPNGVVTMYEYDGRDRLVRLLEDFGGADEEITTYQYEGRDLLQSITDAAQQTSSFEYDTRGRLVRAVDAEGYETVFVLDAVSNVVEERRGLTPGAGVTAQVVAFTYDALDRRVTRTVDPGGAALIETLVYSDPSDSSQLDPPTPGSPLVRQVIDARGKVGYVHYDANDRPTKVVLEVGTPQDDGGDADDVVSTISYDPKGNEIATVDPEGVVTTMAYDAFDRVVERTLDAGGLGLTTRLSYHGVGAVRSVELPNGNTVDLTYDTAHRLDTAGDALGLLQDYEYDAGGNVLSRSDALGRTWRFEYDRRDRVRRAYDPLVESPVDAYSEYQYDAVGNRVLDIDNAGVRTAYVHDALGRVLQVIEDAQGTDPATQDTATTYTYDGANQLLTRTDHDGNTTGYTYDLAGRLTHVVHPDEGAGGPGTVIYGHDEVGNVVSRVDQRGVQTLWLYDDLGRAIYRYYASSGKLESFEYDRLGRPTRARSELFDRTFTYDPIGRRTSSTLGIAGIFGFTTTYAHSVDPTGMQRSTTYPGGRVVTHTYDRRSRLASVAASGLGTVAAWTHDAADRRLTTARSNGVDTEYAYDLNGRLTSLRHADQAGALFDFEYGYDATGRRTSTRDLVHGGHDELYQLDDRYRLVGFQRGTLDAQGGAIVTPTPASYFVESKSWTLDSRGNWLGIQTTLDGATSSESRQVNGVNEYTSVAPDGGPAVAPVYDHAGNILRDGSRLYSYDEENRLLSVSLAGQGGFELLYFYDALGNRVGRLHKSGEITVFVSDGLPQVLEERALSGALLREYVYGEDPLEPLVLVDHTAAGDHPQGQAEPLFYLQDVQRNVLGLTDAGGALVEEYRYEPYGTTRFFDGSGTPLAAQESSFGNPLLWTGQRYEERVGLYHFAFRSYDPGLGRWLQRDPLGAVDGASLYEHVRSDPVSLIDPLGLVSETVDQSGSNEKDYWRVDYEVNSKDGQVKDGNVHVHYGKTKDDAAKIYYNPDDGKFYYKGTGDEVKGKLKKKLLNNKKLMKAVGKGVDKVSSQTKKFYVGPKKGVVTVSAILLGLLADSAFGLDVIAGSKWFTALLNAIKNGNLTAADRFANELYLDLLEAGMKENALLWLSYWNNVLRPKIEQALLDRLNNGSSKKNEKKPASPKKGRPGTVEVEVEVDFTPVEFGPHVSTLPYYPDGSPLYPSGSAGEGPGPSLLLEQVE